PTFVRILHFSDFFLVPWNLGQFLLQAINTRSFRNGIATMLIAMDIKFSKQPLLLLVVRHSYPRPIIDITSGNMDTQTISKTLCTTQELGIDGFAQAAPTHSPVIQLTGQSTLLLTQAERKMKLRIGAVKNTLPITQQILWNSRFPERSDKHKQYCPPTNK